MDSLVILMIEEEQPEGLSARKLVVETVKHNVLTAYTAADGVELLRRFPRVDAVLVHAAVLERHRELLGGLREMAPEIPLILASPGGAALADKVDFVVDSHRPQELLMVLADLGAPETN